jgi:Predicted AAA-ATPase
MRIATFQHLKSMDLQVSKEKATLVFSNWTNHDKTTLRIPILTDLRNWYDGYRFHRNAQTHLYNPEMVLHFLQKLVLKRATHCYL